MAQTLDTDALNGQINKLNTILTDLYTSLDGKETPLGAQQKADQAKSASMGYSDQKIADLAGAGRTSETVKGAADSIAAQAGLLSGTIQRVDTLEHELSNIGGVSVDAEIAQARGGFPLLGDRLNNSDAKLNDIGVWRNYTNMIQNGDFSNGSTGWTAIGGTLAVNSGRAVLTGNGTAQSIFIQRPVSMSGTSGKVLVVGTTISVAATNAWSFDIVLWGTGGSGYTNRTLKQGGIASGYTYTLYSSYVENALTSISQAAVRYSAASGNTSSVVTIDNVMLFLGESSDIGLSSYQLAEKYPYTSGTNMSFQLLEGKSYIDVATKGVVGNGTTDDAPAIQALFSSYTVGGGDIYFAPKTYLINSDVKISGTTENLRLIGYGAVFTGTGKFILDSCKHVEMDGFNLKAVKLSFRGVWWSSFKNMDVGQLIVGDLVGSAFSDNYWNDFYKVGMGQLLLDVNRGHFNANSFYSCYFRSDPNQGFKTQYDYNIKINAAGTLLQNNNFYGCDLSYASVSPIYVDSGNSQKDTCITFDRCYFDTSQPNINQNAIIVMKDCLCATADYLTNATTDLASKAEVSSIDALRFAGWQPTSAYNFFKDGTFMTGSAGGSIVRDASTTVTYSKTGGMIHGYADIRQPNSVFSVVYFVAPVPVDGYYTNLLYLKNNDAGNKTLRIAMGGNYFNVTINNSKWTRVSLCGNSVVTAGTSVQIIVYTPDNTPYNMRVGCVGIMFGRQSQLLPVPDYKAYIDSKVP